MPMLVFLFEKKTLKQRLIYKGQLNVGISDVKAIKQPKYLKGWKIGLNSRKKIVERSAKIGK